MAAMLLFIPVITLRESTRESVTILCTGGTAAKAIPTAAKRNKRCNTILIYFFKALNKTEW